MRLKSSFQTQYFKKNVDFSPSPLANYLPPSHSVLCILFSHFHPQLPSDIIVTILLVHVGLHVLICFNILSLLVYHCHY